MIISHKNIYDAEAVLKNNKKIYLWLYRVLVNNGLAYYATWVTVATCLNFSIALTYRSGGINRKYNFNTRKINLMNNKFSDDLKN